MSSEDASFASIRWSWIASGALLVAIVAVITAVVVLSLHGADALASIALALAILSFVTQFIVYIVQTQNAAAQLRASQQINLRTQETLTEIVQKTSRVETTVGGQMQKMIDAILGQLPAAAKDVGAKTGLDAASIEQMLDARLRPILDRFPVTRPRPVSQRRLAEDREVLRRIAQGGYTHPTETIARIAEALGPKDRSDLLMLLEDERDSRQRHFLIGLQLGTQTLDDLELVDAVPEALQDPQLAGWRRLTPLGLDVALYGEKQGWQMLRDDPDDDVPPDEDIAPRRRRT